MMLSIDQAIKIRETVLNTGGGYRTHPGRMMNVGMQPIFMTEEEFEATKRRGQQIFDLEDKLNRIYADLAVNDPKNRIVQLIEARLTNEARQAQRLIARERPLSLLKRTDETRPGFVVEVQKRCGGMGFHTAWCRGINQYFPLAADEISTSTLNGHVLPLTWMMQGLEKGPNTIVLITPQKDLPSQSYLANLINAETDFVAIPLIKEMAHKCIKGTTVHLNDDLTRLLEKAGYNFPRQFVNKDVIHVGMFYRRELTLANFIQFEGWDELFEAYLQGDVIIQPELNLVEDMKLPCGFTQEPQIREQLSALEQQLLPITAVMPSSWTEEFTFGDETLTLDLILENSKSNRKYIIKYAGTSMEYGLGGRAVYRLSDMSRGTATCEINGALKQIQQGHHWIIQEQDQTYHEMTHLIVDEDGYRVQGSTNMYVRYCFYYFRDGAEVKLVQQAEAAVRRIWKATAADDAIIAPIRVKKNASVTPGKNRIVTSNNMVEEGIEFP